MQPFKYPQTIRAREQSSHVLGTATATIFGRHNYTSAIIDEAVVP